MNDEELIKQFMRQHRTEISDQGFSKRVIANIPYRRYGMFIPSSLLMVVLVALLAYIVQQQLFLPILYDVLNFAFRVIQQIKFIHVIFACTLLVMFVAHQMQQEG